MKPSVKIALFGVFFLAVIGIGTALYLYNKKPADLQNVKPEFTMTAGELLHAFESDEVNATVKYVNKVIDVSGVVATSLSGENTYTIALITGSSISFVICTFQNTSNMIQPLVGETITVRGTCSGYLMDVLMNNCVAIIK